MRLLRAEVTNFGSYKHLKFDFNNQGLTLIHGATGSGKSTLQDIATWILFGITSKDGNADEVKRFGSEEKTHGALILQVRDMQIRVVRYRGKIGENDLYMEDRGERIRGKDTKETQKIIEEKIGITPELYLAAACYNEFSPTSNFFSAKAKDRRELFEKIADLELPILLSERLSDERKKLKKTIVSRTSQYDKEGGRLEQLQRTQARTQRDAEGWSKSQDRKIQEIKARAASFEATREVELQDLQEKKENWDHIQKETINNLNQSIEELTESLKDHSAVCAACGSPSEDYQEIKEKINKLNFTIGTLSRKTNPWDEKITSEKFSRNTDKDRLEEVKRETNPFIAQLEDITASLIMTENLVQELRADIDALEHKFNSMEQLQDMSLQLRGELLKRSVKEIEESTNKYLENYFDSELRVAFRIENSDSLEVSLWKSGNECVFKQLSKGQRGLLKLCFAVSIMSAASNKAGIHFSTLCFDEALDGLDNNLKVKAFRLFEELSLHHETVLVIDHSEELKALFSKKYHVTMSQDISSVEEA